MPPSTAPGIDGQADTDRVFTTSRLKAALLPARSLGADARVTATVTGRFGDYGRGDFGTCEAREELERESRDLDGDNAQQTVRVTPAAQRGDRSDPVEIELASMTAGRAQRYLDIRQRLLDACPVVTVDTEAAPVREHHRARSIGHLGDSALLETERVTGGDEYDGVATHDVVVRAGGVLVLVRNGGDEDRAVRIAALATRRVRAELYGADPRDLQGR
ncbi:hypothetical protein [Streptomyces tsukubensis]|uniref:Uncharacterized protein n=1 Tax=Streptomyces tsukubensis TaxID=83656 RepID=A0A1V4AG17_9ACTN|nr:hypothetical protein [Streptomyces tsukubensis]OON82551.1 hypothetical protein B1H18_00210 [Streptomyces tsukubensis]QFR92288.1 hypothetical protein GBW32_03480 [Streptomyces tsukubensis]